MYKWIILFLFLFGCKSSRITSSKNSSDLTIVYELPKSVTEILANKIRGNKDSLYFELTRDSSSFSIEIDNIDKNVVDYRWLLSSNHKLKIENSLFPLLIPYDRSFGTKETPTEILLLAKKDQYFLYTMEFMTGEPYHVKFDSKGKILYAGR